MSNPYRARKTLMPSNEFRFECPIFKVTARIADCFRLRELVWKGQNPPVRRGCQSCMRADKCPINNIVKGLHQHDADPYFSETPAMGKLERHDLDRIAPVKVLESWIHPECSPKERELILQANGSAHPVTRSAEPPARRRKSITRPVEVAEEVKPVPAETSSAATTGDMAAVVNSIMQERAA